MIVNKQRNSSIELLRIICMLLIIAHHFTVHGGFSTLNNLETLSGSVMFLRCASAFGKSACSIFAMITGYYMVVVNTKEKYYRRILPLVFNMMFYYLLVALIVHFSGEQLNYHDILRVFFPFIFGNWYLKTYFYLFFFIPYINKLIKEISETDFKKLLITIYVLYYVINTVPTFDYTFGDLIFMINMYLIGAYHRLYKPKIRKADNRKNLLRALGFVLLIEISIVAALLIGARFNLVTIFRGAMSFTTFNNIFSLGFSYYLFSYFANMDFFVKPINIIASTVMPIYMFHDISPMRSLIWLKWYPNANYLASPYRLMFSKVLIIFLVGMTIDLLKQAVIYPFRKLINSKINKVADTIIRKYNDYQLQR